ITVKNHIISVYREGSNNADLKSVSLSPTSDLVKVSTTTTINYAGSVDAGTTQVRVRPTSVSAFAIITVNGIPVASGALTDYIDLNEVGATVINMEIISQNGEHMNAYTITVSKNGSNNAELKSLTLSPTSTLVQIPTTTSINYTTSVAAGTTTVRVRPTAFDAVNAAITVNGTAVVSGALSAPITLSTVDPVTMITILVTAQDGVTTKTYTIAVSKNGSNNAELKSLALSPTAKLMQVASTGTINYITSVDFGATSVKVRPTAVDGAHATITVNNQPVASGALSDAITLNTDGSPTVINVEVTAEDGVTVNRYTISVSRNGSNNADLKALAIIPNGKMVQLSTTSTIN
ncbi:MAG: cadherin-like beta sandwich domain-containing protein, partial [Cytophagaceae bacterium]